MNEFLDEHQYAWRLIRAARQVQSETDPPSESLADLLDAAMDAGLDRETLILELAQVGGRLLALWDPVVCLT